MCCLTQDSQTTIYFLKNPAIPFSTSADGTLVFILSVMYGAITETKLSV